MRGGGSVRLLLTLDTDQRTFLGTPSLAFLIVNGDRGVPVGYPMTLMVARDGGLEFSTYRKSAKVRHIERDDRVCVVVVPRESDGDGRALRVWGHASIREGGSSGAAATVIHVPDDVIARAAEQMASGKRVTIRVDPVEAAW